MNDRQASFVREYVLDKNGTQAAIRAGYSERTANQQASRLLVNVDIRAAIDSALKALAIKTETSSEWVRRRLREEAEDFSEFSSQSARVRAVELVAKLNGDFEKDNTQKGAQLLDLWKGLTGKVVRPDPAAAGPDGEVEERDD